jgi:hypothetical protein
MTDMWLTVEHGRSPDGVSSMRATVRGGLKFSFEHRFRGPISEPGDSALAAALLPAMRKGGRLLVDAPVSPRLLGNTGKIQAAFLEHRKKFWPVEIAATQVQEPLSDGGSERGVGLFFSGGVDSFYSALTHRDELTHLVFVHGFDIRLVERQKRRLVADSLRSAADGLGLQLIEVETTIHDSSDRHVSWEWDYFGSAMVSVGLLLAPVLRKIYIASSYAPDYPVFGGSSPLVDPLWSSEQVEIVHDTEVRRVEKLGVVAASPVAPRWVRPCMGDSRAYNCGRCRKCLGVMVALRLAGVPEDSTAFPKLDLSVLARMPLIGGYVNRNMLVYLQKAEQKGDEELAAALRLMVARATPVNVFINRVRDRASNSYYYRRMMLLRMLGR